MTNRTPEQWDTMMDITTTTFTSLAAAIGESIKNAPEDSEMVEVPRYAALSMMDFFLNMRQLAAEVKDKLGEGNG